MSVSVTDADNMFNFFVMWKLNFLMHSLFSQIKKKCAENYMFIFY